MFVTAANKESICAENDVIQVELRQLSYFLPVANVGKRSDEHVPCTNPENIICGILSTFLVNYWTGLLVHFISEMTFSVIPSST